jgi:tetratricopeptide (TPR) repeat protein
MDAEARKKLDLARQARKRGDHHASFEYLQAAIAIDPDQISLKVEAASDLLEVGRLDEAEAALHELLKRSPQHFVALTVLAQVSRKRGDRTASLTYYQTAHSADPSQMFVLLQMGHDLRELGRLDEAEAVLQKLLEHRPQHFDALMALAQVARKRNDRTASLNYYQAAESAADPTNTGAYLRLASAYRELGRLDEAEAVLQKLLEHRPQHFDALMALAQVARKRNDRTASLSWLQAALAANPPTVDAKLRLASALRELSNFDTAEQVCRQVLSDTPTQSRVITELGLIARDRGKKAEALALFRSAAEANSKDVRARLELATELSDRGLYTEAETNIESALQIEPRNENAWLQRGYLQRRAGNHEAARDTFRKILECNPAHLQALVDLAKEERMLGQYSKAEDILNKVLELDPQYYQALAQLAECVRLRGDLENALGLYKRAIEINPRNMWPYMHASQTLGILGDLVAAIELLDQATLLFGPQPQLVSTRTQLLKRVGRVHEARELVEAALNEHPHNFQIWAACVRLNLFFGDLDAADKKLQGFSTELVSELSQIHIFRGQLAEAQGKFDGAMHHYDIAIRLNPQDRMARSEMFRVCLLTLKTEKARDHLLAWTQLGASAKIARRRPVRMSQSAMGQIYNEFVLNKNVLDQLIDIQNQTPKERVRSLQLLLQLNPDHTPAAIQFIIALRQAGCLETPSFVHNSKSSGAIPRSIIQYWDAPEPPPEVKLYTQTWQDWNTDFAYRLFDDAAAKEFLIKRYPADVLRAYQRMEHPAEKADLFRLAYLYAEGGIYADADDRCIGPVSDVLPPHSTLVVFQEDYALAGLAVGTLANNFLAAAPNNAVIGRALEMACQAINRGDKDFIWLKTGPALVTRAFAQVIAETPLLLPTPLKNIVLLDRSTMTKVSAFHCFCSYKSTKHWTKPSELPEIGHQRTTEAKAQPTLHS